MTPSARNIDNRAYLKYLFQSLNLDKLKATCREFNIKGYSKYKKSELVEFILDSLSEEEITALIKKKEPEIISEGINLAIEKINGKDRESITAIKVVNPDIHEIELTFKGFNWETESYLIINDKNINDPERDCDCRIGAEMGFCSHFWVGFIFALKNGFFKLTDWNLTFIPENFESKIQSINISSSDDSGEAKLVDQSSDDYLFQKFLDQSITVHEAEVVKIEEKEQVFQERETIYYLGSLKNVRLGPKIQKKGDLDDAEVVNIQDLAMRISEKLQGELTLKPGDKITFNGTLKRDNFLKLYIVKNIRKITII
ncbi:MAG: hypothetical protein EU533_05035 [Promethearchaeota archaeon]|nr:MAG: hypothetical protein EU533_05035 [Candidatus Lokiarchaeota archaeon]